MPHGSAALTRLKLRSVPKTFLASVFHRCRHGRVSGPRPFVAGHTEPKWIRSVRSSGVSVAEAGMRVSKKLSPVHSASSQSSPQRAPNWADPPRRIDWHLDCRRSTNCNIIPVKPVGIGSSKSRCAWYKRPRRTTWTCRSGRRHPDQASRGALRYLLHEQRRPTRLSLSPQYLILRLRP